MWNRFLKWLGLKKEWLIYSYDAAQYTLNGIPYHYCTYTIKYFPKSHTASLTVTGYKAKEHSYYIQIILPRFYHFKNLLLTFSREDVVNYIKSMPIKHISFGALRGPEVHAQEKIAQEQEESVESIQEKIKHLLAKEKYEEVAKLQEKLDKRLKEEK